IDARTLADICKAMEEAIVDVTVTFELYNIPPMTFDDEIVMDPYQGGSRPICRTRRWTQKGPSWETLTAKRPFNEWLLSASESVVTNERGETIKTSGQTSYGGKQVMSFSKRVLTYKSDDGTMGQRTFLEGNVSTFDAALKPSLILTPFGFSVFRFSYDREGVPLSDRLRKSDMVSIDTTITRVNDSNAIRADFMFEGTRTVVTRVFFSMDHGYTPIRYEFMNGPNLAFSVDVTSLQSVGNGLWFPSSGVINVPDAERVTAFRTKGPIIVNQGLTERDFNITFPAGTRVENHITGKTYTVQPTE
ncbi:MAG TPA: hypothetical protein VLH60_01365, partial [Sedimentisphaerales bacterium]|nr:hypothetical protein [Sedimentisphaerales bacterium]